MRAVLRVLGGPPVSPGQPMPFAFVETDWMSFFGFQAAVFAAVVVVLMAVQWLFDRKGRR